MSKSVRKIIGTAAPLAGLIPGVGLPLAVGLGAGGGLLSGGGLRGAVTGGLGGAISGGGGGLLGSALGAGNGAAGAALGTGLLGAGAGGASGGLKGALLGGGLGAAGGYLSKGGLTEMFPETSNYLYNATDGLVGSGSSPLSASQFANLSPSAGGSISGGGNLSLGSGGSSAGGFGGLSDLGKAVLQSSSAPSSGITSSMNLGTGGGASTYASGGSGGLSFSPLQLGATALGGLNSFMAGNQAKKDLINAEKNAQAQLQPYLNSGGAANSRLSTLLGIGGDPTASDYGSLGGTFTPGDLTQDPGYKFQLEQGQQALARKQSATGNTFSGSALKEAADYSQGLADRTYNDAYNRWLQGQQNTYGMFAGQSGAGQNAAGAAGNIAENIGNAKANAGIYTANNINSTLSGLLAGMGAKKPVYNNYGQIIGYSA